MFIRTAEASQLGYVTNAGRESTITTASNTPRPTIVYTPATPEEADENVR